MIDRTRMWVHPDFKKMAKKEAAEKDQSILDFTKDLVVTKKRLIGEDVKKKKFDFKI